MSYARFGEDGSDVYVIWSVEGRLICYCDAQFVTEKFSEMITHLEEHVSKGDTVPQRAFDCLKEDMEERGDNAAGGMPTQRQYGLLEESKKMLDNRVSQNTETVTEEEQ